MKTWNIIALTAVLLTACDVTEPEDTQDQAALLDDDLLFVRYAAGVQPAATQASFWAVFGQTRTLKLPYAGQSSSEPPLLEFTVAPLSLLTKPNGLPFLPGDSVLITVTAAVDRFVFDFQPNGLVFSPVTPATLRLNYAGGDNDVNGDGLINFMDSVIEQRLQIWTQAAPGLPWLPIPSSLAGVETLQGRVTHFTGFALAD
jgi:hypothetical protein